MSADTDHQSTGRLVLVTGGNRGIGLAIARSFQAAGDRVVITHRSGSAPEGLNGVIMDVTDRASVESAFTSIEAEYGTVDVLIALSGMMQHRAGRVVLMGSVVGLVGSAGQVNYAATKSALVGMARSFAREYGSRGITFNVVAPGFVESDMTAVLADSLKEKYLAQIPLARFASVDEIAHAVRFIASEDAGYITGAVIPIDGGLGMGN